MKAKVLSRVGALGSLKSVTRAPSTILVSTSLSLRVGYHNSSIHATPSYRFSLPVKASSFATQTSRNVSYEQKAKDLNQQGVDEALSEFETAVADDQEKQQRAPWHREGVDEPPVRRQRSAGAMTKGTSDPVPGETCQLTFVQGSS